MARGTPWRLVLTAALGVAGASCHCGHAESGLCEGCVPACQSDADCAPGQACVGRVCLERGCSSDADCAAGRVCAANVCVPPDAGLLPDGGCGAGRSCGEFCVPASGCCTSADCPDDGACVQNQCVPPVTRDAGPLDAGPPGAGPLDAGPPDAGPPAPDAGPCQPTCSAASCGGPDGCGGTCAPCCYRCQVGPSSCSLDTQLQTQGACPAGYTTTQPACTPCWSCGAGSAYCTAPSCCGTHWTTQGYVGGGCTCYGCNNHGYGPDVQSACVAAQGNTLAASSGGWCPWPQSPYTAFCGFAGYAGSTYWYDGGTPGGCDCSFSCGSASQCCVPKGWPVTSAAQCCSGQLGACTGSGTGCCQ